MAQGRSHVVRLAEEGADTVAVDLARGYDAAAHPQYSAATPEQLKETGALVEKTGRGCVIALADVRDRVALQAAVDAGLDAFGHRCRLCERRPHHVPRALLGDRAGNLRPGRRHQPQGHLEHDRDDCPGADRRQPRRLLSGVSPEFRQWWATHEVVRGARGAQAFRHPSLELPHADASR